MVAYSITFRKGSGNIRHNTRDYAKEDYIPKNIDKSKTHLNRFYGWQSMEIGFKSDFEPEELEKTLKSGRYRIKKSEDPEKEDIVCLNRIESTNDIRLILDFRYRDIVKDYREKVIERSKARYKKNQGRKAERANNSSNKKKKPSKKKKVERDYVLNKNEKADLKKGASEIIFNGAVRTKDFIFQIGGVDQGQPKEEDINIIEEKLISKWQELHPEWIVCGYSHRDEKSIHLHILTVPLADMTKESELIKDHPELKDKLDHLKEKGQKNNKGKRKVEGNSYNKGNVRANNDLAIFLTENPSTGHCFSSWDEWRSYFGDEIITELMKERGVERLAKGEGRKIHFETEEYKEIRAKMEPKIREELDEAMKPAIQAYEEQVKSYDKQVKNYEQQVLDLSGQVDQLGVEIDDLNADVNRLNANIDQLNADIRLQKFQMAEDYKNASEKLDPVLTEAEKIQADMKAKTEEVRRLLEELEYVPNESDVRSFSNILHEARLQRNQKGEKVWVFDDKTYHKMLSEWEHTAFQILSIQKPISTLKGLFGTVLNQIKQSVEKPIQKAKEAKEKFKQSANDLFEELARTARPFTGRKHRKDDLEK